MIENDANFKNFVKQHSNPDEKQFITKGKHLYEIGKSIGGIYFCEPSGSGIVRAYTLDKETGNEITNKFFSENDIIVPFISLVDDVPSIINFQVIEDGWFSFIPIENWKIFEKQEPDLAMGILCKMAVDTSRRSYEYQLNNTRNTLARYRTLRKKYPYLERVPDEYIASYLGVTRRTIVDIKPKL